MIKYNLNNKSVCLMESYDGFAMFIASYILQILLQFAFSMLLVATGVAKEFTESTVGICLLVSLNESAMLITPFVYSKIKGENLFGSVGWKTKLSVGQIFTLVGIAVATVLAFAPLANWFVRFIIWTGYDTSSLASLEMTSWGNYILGLLFMCVLPAICEEFLYRGMIARALGDKGMVFGVLMTATLFALMHGSPIQLVHQFFLGAVCVVVYYMTRSIWSSVIIHFVNNAIAVTGNFILTKTGKADMQFPEWASAISMVVGLGILAGLAVLFYKLSVNREKVPAKEIVGSVKEHFYTQDEKAVIELERATIQNQLDQCDSQEMREVMMSTIREDQAKLNKKGRLALIYALILGIGVWVMNTVLNYVK